MLGSERIRALLQCVLHIGALRPFLAAFAVVLFVTVSAPCPTHAQVTVAPPSDALVLGAGGARGLAHVGALVALAEAGYAPDLVVGTSMGAVVGALYAAGLTPAEIEAMVQAVDWQTLLLPAPELIGSERRAFVPQVRYGLAGTERRPIDGFIDDRRINRTLVRVFFDANMRARGDFDALATPYRAVTSDLRDGRQVILTNGDLARAARTSLAVPGAFAPLAWDGAVLADGGIANFLATSVAAREGAARIVAVDVLRPRADLGRPGPVTALFRALRLTFRNALPDTMADVLIVPDVAASTSSAIFPSDPSRLLRLGYEAARLALSDSGAAPPGHGHLDVTGGRTGSAGSADRALPPAPTSIAAVEIDADSSLLGVVRAAFAPATGLTGDGTVPYEPDRILAAADRLYATGLFAGVWLAPAPGPSAESVTLRVRAEAAPPLVASAAVAYDRERGPGGWLRTTWRPGGPLSVVGALFHDGIETAAALEFARPWTALPPLSWTAGASVRRTDVPYPSGEVPGIPDPFGGSTAVGATIGSALRVDRVDGWLGFEWRRVAPDVTASATVRVQQLDIAGAVGDAVGPYLRIERHAAPSESAGGPTGFEVEATTGDYRFQRARLFAGPVMTLGWFRLALNLDVAAASVETPPDAVPALGDYAAIPGLAWGQERGRARFILGPDLAAPIPFDGFIRLRLRAGAATAEPADWLEADPWLGGAALEAVWHSIVGQLVVGVGAASNGDRRFILRVGGSY